MLTTHLYPLRNPLRNPTTLRKLGRSSLTTSQPTKRQTRLELQRTLRVSRTSPQTTPQTTPKQPQGIRILQSSGPSSASTSATALHRASRFPPKISNSISSIQSSSSPPTMSVAHLSATSVYRSLHRNRTVESVGGEGYGGVKEGVKEGSRKIKLGMQPKILTESEISSLEARVVRGRKVEGYNVDDKGGKGFWNLGKTIIGIVSLSLITILTPTVRTPTPPISLNGNNGGSMGGQGFTGIGGGGGGIEGRNLGVKANSKNKHIQQPLWLQRER